MATGNERFADVVIYDSNGIISDTPLSDVDYRLCAKEVLDWSVQVDQHDTDNLIVRIKL